MNDSARLAAYINTWCEDHGISRKQFVHMAEPPLAQNFFTNLERGADIQLSTVGRAAERMDMTLLGLLKAAGIGVDGSESPVARPDMLELIRTDPDLLPEARQHFASQYGLLRRLSPTSGSGDKDGGH